MNATLKQPYLSDLEAVRKRAREQIMKGAVTPSFEEHAEDLVDLLQDVPKD